MKKIFLFLALIPLSLFSQPDMKPNTGIIVGKVLDSRQNPLEYVTVYLYKDSTLIDGTMTDAEGKFFFKNIPYGTYSLETKFIGFRKKRINNIQVSENQRFVRVGKIIISQNEKELQEVVVEGQKTNIKYEIDKKIVNVSQELQASGGSAVDVLQNVPSVQVDIEGNVTLRGSSNFTVLINGKPSILEGNDALQQIPASSIEKIEIITNPSAKYDPDGVAGIINIITKKNADNGLSGKIELAADTKKGYNTDVLLVWKKNKIEVFGEIQYRKRLHLIDYYQDRLIYSGGDTLVNKLISSGLVSFQRGGLIGKTGVNLYFNDKNSLGFTVEYGTRAFGSQTQTQTEQKIYYPAEISYKYSQNSVSELSGYTGKASVDFEHKFNSEGHKITGFVDISFWKPFKINELTLDTTEINGQTVQSNIYREKTEENRFNRKFRFQTDYELPLSDRRKFEAGFVVRLMQMNYDFNYFVFNPFTNEWQQQPQYSAYLGMQRNIYGGYITYSDEFGPFGMKLGLRSEFTDRNIQDLEGTDYPYKKLDFFPTAHFSLLLPADQKLQLSYSRRINRPRGWFLNPSLRYYDRFTLQQGNPALKPEYANNIELNYMKSFGKRNYFSVENYFRQTVNKIDRIQKFENQQVIFTWENINTDIAAGTELMLNIAAFKILMMNFSVNGFYNRITGVYENMPVDKSTFSWSGRYNLMTFLPFGFGLQFGGFYRAKSLSLQGVREPMFMSFAGLKKSFFKRKLSVSVSARDVFNTAKFKIITDIPGLSSTTEMDFIPVVSFSLKYRINNYKQDRKKQFSQEETDFMGEGEY